LLGNYLNFINSININIYKGCGVIRLIKHDRYIEQLCEAIEDEYDQILRNIKLYSKKRRISAEIDILAIKGNHCDIYEVKCSNRIVKAKKQLTKIRKILSKEYTINNTYFFCGASGKIIEL